LTGGETLLAVLERRNPSSTSDFRLNSGKLEDDAGACLLTDVMHGANAWRIQCRGGLRFAPKTAQGLWVLGDFVRQKFERDKAIFCCL